MRTNNSTIVFLLPVKPFRRAKTRLAPLFPQHFRERVALALFQDTIDILTAFSRQMRYKVPIKTIICSNDEFVANTCNQKTEILIYLKELPRWTSLDKIIFEMNEYAMNVLNARATILIMGDLPLLSVYALKGLFKNITQGKNQAPKVILSPSLGNGCNMVARTPPDIVQTFYDDASKPSFLAMLDAAKQATSLNKNSGSKVEIYKNLEFYLDLDTESDLVNLFPLLNELRPTSNLLNLLKSMQVEITKSKENNDNRSVNIRIGAGRTSQDP